MSNKALGETSPNRGREVEVRLVWDLKAMTPEQRKLLWDVARGMRALGVGFDTGTNGSEMDWEWDWSLSGPVKVTFVGFVDENEKNRYTFKHENPKDVIERVTELAEMAKQLKPDERKD